MKRSLSGNSVASASFGVLRVGFCNFGRQDPRPVSLLPTRLRGARVFGCVAFKVMAYERGAES